GFKEAERYFTMTRVERRRCAPEDTLGFGRAIRQPRGWCTVERRPSGLPILRALVPIHLDEEAAPRGVLAADVPLADLLAQAARSGAVPAFDPSSSIVRFAVDRDSGVFLFHDDVSQLHRPVSVSERDLGTRLAALELLDATRVQAESSARRGRYRAADGGEWQVMALADARLGVVVGASAAYERLLVPFRNAAALVALATLGLIALSGVLILVFSRSFRRSLRDLLGASTAYARGMFSHRVPVRPQDDLAPLALQLNAMAGDLERLIVEREEAARFESVSRVASLVAHDLKGLVFSLSLLADNLAAGAPDERSRRRAVGSLEALVRKMKKTVTQLPQAGRTREVDRRRLDLAALVRDTVAELGVETMESVDVQTRLDRPAWIDGDADALRRVVSNLLWNALEAMPGGGRLQVQVRERSGSVWLSVSDTGRGMSEQFVRASLFKPFHTTKERGLGLGMVAVRDGVEAHGGRIEVESAEGRGTTFTLRFPAARPLEADSATAPRMRGASAQAVPRTLRSGAEPRTDQEKSS
ncbi:MAG: sensor histidine kinase, partial [Candidatus Krumholzibacteriia bacterium]